MVPGYTDSDHDVHLLGQFIEGMTNIEKVGASSLSSDWVHHKWKTLGLDYELEDVLPPTKRILRAY